MIPTRMVFGCSCGCIYHIQFRNPQCPLCKAGLSHARKLEGLFP
jgi:hypothetical protein